jgi:hypothetical protein
MLQSGKILGKRHCEFLEEANSQLQNYQYQIQQLQLQLEQAKKTIDLMENDQFAKLRSLWRKIQQKFS